MAEQALAGEIVAALLADEKDGGYDLEAGMFGPNFSALVRRWVAAEWESGRAPPTNALHTFGCNDKGEVGLRAARTSFDPSGDHRIMECALMFREAVVVRKQTNIDPFVLWEHIMGSKWAMTGKIELGESAPIDMLLYCPNCGVQHIDRPDTPEDGADWNDPEIAWANPPHRTHLCHACGCTWRPADVPTNGVEAIKTEGENDSWKVPHDLYKDGDDDIPGVICDRNGQVTLDLCKRCGKGEAQLDGPCTANQDGRS